MSPAERRERLESLENLIRNFTTRDKGKDPRVLAAIEEINRLRFHMEPRKSVAAIRRAAEVREFLSYSDVANESGLSWQEARHRIAAHLDLLCQWAHGKGWPLITSIVVEKPNLRSGKLEDYALAGFITAAERLKCDVGTDHRAFLKREQDRTFIWASEHRGLDLFAEEGVGS
ncbi:hypothetical protein RQ831_09665 [Roseomonas gilardii]|uniref:Uncharacterized protein n=1 Tax=Roseomonas gilardii TaxID=257708 RepID=A0ABU3MEX5_9PROT|nr:hypothetical protein [Roseomonas gilardii]MDT8331320.1 hypothetical protein [Roseomonas gilardii]